MSYPQPEVLYLSSVSVYTCPILMDMISQEHFILTYGAAVINN